MQWSHGSILCCSLGVTLLRELGCHRRDRPVKRGERQRTQRKDLIGYASSPIAALYACRDPLREAVGCAALTGAADGQEGEGAAGCVEGQVARIKLAAGDEGLAPLVGEGVEQGET